MKVNELKNKLNFEDSQIWRKIFENHISGDELLKLILNAAKISIATLLINHRCNLRCKHCFYGTDTLFEPELAAGEWKAVIDQLLDIGVRHFHIAGREPFIDNKVIEILEYLKEIKRKKEIKYGIVTNGILLEDYIEELSRLDVDYIDFSIDGTEVTNDWLRGKGSFSKAIKNLKPVLDRKIAEVCIDSVAHAINYHELPVMIRELSKLGADYFFIQPMLPVGRAGNLEDIIINPSQYNDLINSCYSLLKSSNKHITVKLLIYPTMFPFLYKENIKIKQVAHNYMKEGNASLKVKNSTLSFEFHPFCMSHWRSCQITADGYYVGCFMMLTAKDYREYAIGNVRRENIRELWTKSLQSGSLLWKIIKSYDITKCRDCNYFWHCHSGCRVASYIKYGIWSEKDITCYVSQLL